MFTCYCTDGDTKTDANNNQTNVNDSFVGYDVNNNPNFSFWSLGEGLSFTDGQAVYMPSGYETRYYGIVNSPVGDYMATLNISDTATMPSGDTGSRDDTDINETVDVTVLDIDISYIAPIITVNNETVILAPMNDDDDDENGVIDNTQTNVTNEDDLVPITITVTPNNSRVQTYFHMKLYGSGVKVFKNSNRSNEYTLSYNLNNQTPAIDFDNTNSITLYLEPQNTYVATLNFYFYTDFPTPNTINNPTVIFPNNMITTNTVKILGNRINLSSGITDNIENISPGKLIPKYDYLNQGITGFSVNVTGINNYSSDWSSLLHISQINNDDDNIELYSNYQLSNLIENNTEFSSSDTPSNVYVKGIKPGKANITGYLRKNTGAILHKDKLLYTVCQADMSHEPKISDDEELQDSNIIEEKLLISMIQII